MYNYLKNIVPILRRKLFGASVQTLRTPQVIYCTSLYLTDELDATLNINDYYDTCYILDSLSDDLYLSDYETDLNIIDKIAWEINDGC